MTSARDVTRRITQLGGYKDRQVGSHATWKADYKRPDGSDGACQTRVAMHPGDIPIGTLAAIEKDLEPAFGKGWLK
jgi:predicted RNA binding protein YcfA (HicA-like mRNA interferase family)